MVSKIDDLEMVTDVGEVVGTYAGKGDYTFECSDGKYGKDGRDTYLAVKYDDVKESAKPTSMMSAKWMKGSEWHLAWTGLKDNPPTKGELHNPKGAGNWAFFRITEGG
jgi:hypothetical protein